MTRALLLVIVAGCGSRTQPPPPPVVATTVPVDAVASPVDAASIDAPPGDDARVTPPPTLASTLASPHELACVHDDDCVVVPKANCCPCSNGGIGIVVNRAAAKTISTRIAARCGPTVACLTVLSTDPTCRADARPACVDQACTIR